MESHHWITIVIVAAVFYLVGAKFPRYAAMVGF